MSSLSYAGGSVIGTCRILIKKKYIFFTYVGFRLVTLRSIGTRLLAGSSPCLVPTHNFTCSNMNWAFFGRFPDYVTLLKVPSHQFLGHNLQRIAHCASNPIFDAIDEVDRDNSISCHSFSYYLCCVAHPLPFSWFPSHSLGTMDHASWNERL